MISRATAQVLKQHREPCNQLFSEARHRYPHLDSEAFTHYWQETTPAVLDAVLEHRPDQFEETVMALYRHGLALAGLRWCGADSRFLLLQEAWRDVLPACQALIVEAPEQTLMAFTHALKQLQDHPGAQAVQWLQQMRVLAQQQISLTEWLSAGQVLAWRYGMAHYRQSALNKADSLPRALVSSLFELPAELDWPTARHHFEQHHWWTPESPEPDMTLRVRLGGFAGMGGQFNALPLVTAQDNQLYVRCEERCYRLFADAYGVSLKNDTGHIPPATPTPPPRARQARLDIDGETVSLPDLNRLSAVASTHDTVAVTSPDSFQILVFSRRGASA